MWIVAVYCGINLGDAAIKPDSLATAHTNLDSFYVNFSLATEQWILDFH
jgi:hypothetical protein